MSDNATRWAEIARKLAYRVALGGLVIIGTGALLPLPEGSAPAAFPVVGSVETFTRAYERWQEQPATSGDSELVIALQKAPGSHAPGHGLLRLDLIDGFEDPTNKFVMRSVPHMLSMGPTVASDCTEPPLEHTGWSSDGAPDAPGTLRVFPIGAVRQHYRKTLNRVFGVDFRMPTDAELDAIEAFLLSLVAAIRV